jgi:Fe(3+) dicitrate transport protein
MNKSGIIAVLLALLACSVLAQGNLEVTVIGAVEKKPVEMAWVMVKTTGQTGATSSSGKAEITGVPSGNHEIIVHRVGYKQALMKVFIDPAQTTSVIVELESLANLKVVEVTDQSETLQQSWLYPVDPKFAAIYASKKTESILIEGKNANLATNNARQIFNTIPGLNIWESDGAGLQLGIGGRGLSPNRTSNFNTRQNGYDMSADALGYPESYYTPPAEALERIQIVRGAASLQYGTQFGGMVNFVMKEGEDKPLSVISRQTGGSWGFFNSFNSLGGTIGKLNYYGFIQYKRGDGWRPNSQFRSLTGYIALRYDFSEQFNVKLEYTHMNYHAQQPGGLTDELFELDPRQSIRNRNWFGVDWNLLAVTAKYHLSHNAHLNLRGFGLAAQREALGFLGQINRTDTGDERDLISGIFRNAGAELRYVQRYPLFNLLPSTALVGARIYRGYSRARQGLANDGTGPDFEFITPPGIDGSDYEFPSSNFAVFAENMFMVTSKLNITPGIRFEHISTQANGQYNNRITHPLTGTVLFEETIDEFRENDRQLLLLGIGAGYKLLNNIELYANLSQNYRAINFTDMQVVNPNFRIDPNIDDERGYNADLGLRGTQSRWLVFDVSAFYLKYNDRIGMVQRVDSTLFNIYRLRTNVADSRTMGIESFAQINFHQFGASDSSKIRYSLFFNYAFIDAIYLQSEEPAIAGKKVELVPAHTLKTGLNFGFGSFDLTFQYTWLSEQYTDATNAEFTSNAVNGLIPSYHVLDLSGAFEFRMFRLEAGCNNITNNMYFTRRATGYPGPGIIPADGRSLYLTLQIKL